MDKFSKEKRSFIMSRIRDRDTSIELAVRKKLWSLGFKGYRLHKFKAFGKPDIVYTGKKVAIFIDGDFWHGYILKKRAGKLSEYWLNKITKNKKRDKAYTRKLKEAGWKVVRVWEHELLKDFESALNKIVGALA